MTTTRAFRSPDARRRTPAPTVRIPAGGGLLASVPPPPAAPVEGRPKLFSRRARLLGLLWVAAATAVTAVDSRFVATSDQFVVHMVLTSWLVSAPALIVGRVAARRSTSSATRIYWRCYSGATVAMWTCGLGVLVELATGWSAVVAASFAAMALVVVGHAVGGVVLNLTRVGARAAAVDLLDSALVIVAVGAPIVVLRAEAVVRSPYAWLLALSCLAAVAFTSNLWCVIVLLARVGGRSAPAVRAGAVLGAIALLDSLVNIEHVASGFALPTGFVLVFNALAFGMLPLVPLQSSALSPLRFGPIGIGQMRTGRVVGAVLAAAVPLTVLATTATGFARGPLICVTGALTLIVALCTARQLLATAETRRLYDEVERGAEERRSLLAAVLAAIEDDRRRVALQLHEQAAATYTALASLVPHTGPGPRPVGADDGASAAAGRLAARAEALRGLILAIRPDGSPTATGLAPILHAYADGLGDDGPAPAVEVEVDDGLELDWVTETSVLRIAHEAIRNAHRHARARSVRVSLRAEGAVPVLRVADDGVGFDVGAIDGNLGDGTSGLATMRRFAGFCDGELRVSSRPEGGTVVEARLGAPAPPGTMDRRRPLRPVAGGRPGPT